MAAPSILPATEESIAEAARLIAGGRLAAFPTETVYGLGADARNDRAVAAIFEAKGRPRFNPLITHWADARDAQAAARFDARAARLAERFWPGPLTLVLARRPESEVSLLCSAGSDTLALRVPAHPVARRLLAAVGGPVAAPSANRSGGVSPTQAQHVADSLGGKVDLIIDGGACEIGIESTVLDLSGDKPALLRPGAVTLEALEALLGDIDLAEDGEDAPRSPGRLASHYAPQRPLRWGVTSAAMQSEALLAFGPHPAGGFAEMLNLSPRGDLAEAAANFFAMLRALDRPPFAAIAVMPIPEQGLGRAINDRLRRAAAPRPLG